MPLSQTPLRTQIAAFQSSASFGFTTTNKLSKADAYGLFDTTDVQVGDIFVGARTYFVVAFDPIEPALCQIANFTISLYTTAQTLVADDNIYAGRTTSTDVLVASGWPASGVLKARGDAPVTKLPSDTRTGNIEFVLPPIPGVPVNLGMRLTDQNGVAYMVGGIEPLAYGGVKFIAAIAST